MPRCVAFLRAVNVGGRNVKMDALRGAFEALGVTRVETSIASGNVVFEPRARDLAALARKVEAQLNGSFGFEIHTLIRTAEALRRVAVQAKARLLEFRNHVETPCSGHWPSTLATGRLREG